MTDQGAPSHSLPAVLAEGPTWLVIDKPAGLAVHPGPRTPDSLEQLLPAYAPNRPPPQPVHRLDRDTSGCLLLARRASALRTLSRAFEEGAVDKLYWAIIDRAPAADRGVIDAALAKVSSKANGWRMQVDAGGKPARTAWEVLARQGAMALIAFRPETGRTHQIRVHATLLAAGAAIVGDPVYGREDPQGMMLHARGLAFPDPAGGVEGSARISVTAPVPARFSPLPFNWAALA
jgi:tRNA pseudouridine32 synthase/23S rRNA pseudouridine746 synthase